MNSEKRIPQLGQKLLGSALAGTMIFGAAYGAGTGMWWLVTACALGLGYQLGMVQGLRAGKKAQKVNVLTP